MKTRSFVVLAFVAIGCDKPSPNVVVDAGASASASASATATTCASTLASYDALVAAGGACNADADCACFNGGVSPKTPCGGVTDKATASKLDKLITDYESARCSSLSCAAYTCIAACSAGRCVNGAATRRP